MRNEWMVALIAAAAVGCENTSGGDAVSVAGSEESRASGALVPGFGSGGRVAYASLGAELPSGFAIRDSIMIVVGSDAAPGNLQWRIEKRNLKDGSLVPGFGAGGVVTENPSAGDDAAWAVAIGSEFLYVVGWDRAPGDAQWRIEKRRLDDGSLAGVAIENLSWGDDAPSSVAVDGSALYVLGFDRAANWSAEVRIEKRDLDTGALVPEFGSGGVVIEEPGPSDDHLRTMVLDDSFLYLGGYDRNGADGSSRWRIEKRSLLNGWLDESFDGDGIVVVDGLGAPGPLNTVWSLALDKSGLYAVGSARNTPNGDCRWRIQKLRLEDGQPDSSFGDGGVIETNPSTVDDEAIGVVVDGEAVYVSGWDGQNGASFPRWRVEKRSKASGALVPSFGADGVIASDGNEEDGAAFWVAADADSLYLAGAGVGFGGNGGDFASLIEYGVGGFFNLDWRIEKRAK